MDTSALAYWEALARSRWRIVPPLSPSPSDVAHYEAVAARLAAAAPPAAAPFRVLLLGVTPAIARMRWPPGTRLVAVDWAEGMLRNVWPRDGAPAGAALVRADWRALPFAAASFDLVLGDGCYSVFAGLEDAARMNREVACLLRPQGHYLLRCFVRPEVSETVDDLFARLLAGRIDNLDLFRWLLAMALPGDGTGSVRLGDVWRAWHERVPDPAVHRERLGWSADAVANLERWGTLEARYMFPSEADLCVLARPRFEIVAVERPEYAWGERFPRILMRLPREP